MALIARIRQLFTSSSAVVQPTPVVEAEPSEVLNYVRQTTDERWMFAQRALVDPQLTSIRHRAILTLQRELPRRSVEEQLQACEVLMNFVARATDRALRERALAVLVRYAPTTEYVQSALKAVFGTSTIYRRGRALEQLARSLCKTLEGTELAEAYVAHDRNRIAERGLVGVKAEFYSLAWGTDVVHLCGRERKGLRWASRLANSFVLLLPKQSLEARRAFFEANAVHPTDRVMVTTSRAALMLMGRER